MGKYVNRFLVLMLVLIVIVSSCKKKESPEIVEESTSITEDQSQNLDSQAEEKTDTESVVDSETEASAKGFQLTSLTRQAVWTFSAEPGGDWDMPEPYFNPMGSQEAYSDVYYEENSYIDLSYMSIDKNLIERYVYGSYYELYVPFKENLSENENLQFLSDVKTYIEAIGGKVQGIEQDQTVFMVLDKNKDRWWGKISADYENILIELVKERELKGGQTLIIDTYNEENPFYFASYQSGDLYQRLMIKGDEGYASIKVFSRSIYGDYSYESQIGGYIDEEVGSDYIIGSMPLTPGFNIYEVYWDDSDGPETIEITLEESLEVETPQMGEDLGAIKVSAAYVSDVSVTPTNEASTYVYHPEYDSGGGRVDRTPDGDFMIFVPSGYWDVHLSLSESAVISEYATIGVPVSSGTITEVVVPYPMAASMSNQNTEYNSRGIEIGKITEDQDAGQVTFEFTMLDDKTSQVPPSLDNTSVFESGHDVVVTNIEHVDEPPKIVLLLDSSGSMKGQLNNVKAAAKTFLEGLQSDSQVILVDFDSEVKVFSGTSVDNAVSNIDSLSVGGSTALYDALKEGVGALDRNERSTIVLFTDGENDLDGQETITKEETVTLLQESGVPVYAIGFDQGHDGKTLNDFAKASQGLYFDAQDSTALNQVFASIQERLGSTYRATYERPTVSGYGDVPVVTFMVDTSGSMDEIDEGNGQRMNNVKNLLSPFIMDLPDETLVQLIGFVDRPYVIQSLTTDKRKLLQGISAMESGGSTEVPGAVLGGWLSLKEVPSSKKVMIFITDEAMEPDDELFMEAVENLNKDGIEVLWVGLGLDEVAEAFEEAARLSESDYVVTSDVDVLTQAFEKVLSEVNARPANDLSQISIEVAKENELGAREEYGDTAIVQLSELFRKGSEPIELIRESYVGDITQYDPEIAQKLLGFSGSEKETIITGRVVADKSRSGLASDIYVGDVVYMSKLYGVEAPSGYRFLSLDLKMTNVLEEQEVMVYPDGSNHPSAYVAGGGSGQVQMLVPDYLIPDFRSHLFVSVNEGSQYPASDATWLAGQPIADPGQVEIFLPANESREGMLVFLVPDEPIENLSLHLFDTANGGTHVPIIGEMDLVENDVTTMPDGVGIELNDTFSINIGEVHDIEDTYADSPNEETSFKEVEGLLTSNVNALLELEPTERIHLQVPTTDGDLWLDIHEATSLVPFGYYQKRQLAPGSNNKVVWLFEMPKVLLASATSLHFDLFGDDVVIPVSQGSTIKMTDDILYETKGEGFTLRIHDVIKTGDYTSNIGGGMLVVDLTIADEKDGFSTQGIPELFYFIGKVPDTDDYYGGYMAWQSQDLIFGLDDDSIVYDGTQRRGYLVFQPEAYNDEIEWTLESSVFSDLKLSPINKEIEDTFTYMNTPMDVDENFYEAMLEAVYEKIERYEKTTYTSQTQEQKLVVESLQEGDQVPVPMISLYGDQVIQDVKTIQDVKDILKSLTYIPSQPYEELFIYSYSAEATITQGFATENDYANVALTLLGGLGLKAKETKVEIDDAGRDLLTRLSGVEVTREVLPAVSFYDKGQEHIWVMPFVEELTDLTGYCYYSRDQGFANKAYEGTITVYLEVQPLNPDRMAQMDMMSGALAGDTEGQIPIYLEEIGYRYIPESEMSLDALDLGFAVENNALRTYLLRMNGIDWLDKTVNLNDYDVKGVVIEANIGGKVYKHRTALYNDRGIEHLFMTLGMNLPDLSQEAISALNDKKEDLHDSSDDASDMAALRWYGRNIISQFIEGQSAYEKELAESMDLIVGRTEDKRMMVVSMKAPVTDDKGKKHDFEASIDLVDCFNHIHNGEEEAIHGFNILSGLYMTNLEMEILGDGGYGAFEIMDRTPDGTEMIVMEPYLADEDTDAMIEAGLPEHIVEYMLDLNKIILMPNQPAVIDGTSRWAWFEIDPETYETIGVIDTGEKGAMVSNVIIDTVKNSGQYMVGGFVGITVSIWSVSAISLEEDDYKKILEEAKKFALGMKDSFGIKKGIFSMGVGGKPSLSQSFGPIKYSFDGKGAWKQNIVGFTQGFEAGVNYYFDNAE